MQELGWDAQGSDRLAKLGQRLSSTLVSEIRANWARNAMWVTKCFLGEEIGLTKQGGMSLQETWKLGRGHGPGERCETYVLEAGPNTDAGREGGRKGGREGGEQRLGRRTCI